MTPVRRPVPWPRGSRGVIGIVAAVLLTVTVLSVLAVRSAGHGGDLDPDNPDSNGARAVARVLAAHGVQVSVVRRAAALERSVIDPGTTVLVTSSEHLGRTSARRLGVRTVDAGALVLAAPGPVLRAALRLPVTAGAVRDDRRRPAACDDPLLAGLSVDVGTSPGYRSSDPRVTTCFVGPGGAGSGLVARVDEHAATYAVAGAGLFTNDRVASADNAAVALRLLGQHDRLVWYVPDVRDVPAGDTGSLADQLPGGLVPAGWLVLAALLAAMLWRGRRLGPLVVEPLPVVVKAVESTQGRGRLYRRVRDQSHAAGILRSATRHRLAARLRLPAGTGPPAVASAVAAVTGTEPATVLEVLVTRPVTDDDDLTRLAGDLSALEREVRTR